MKDSKMEKEQPTFLIKVRAYWRGILIAFLSLCLVGTSVALIVILSRASQTEVQSRNHSDHFADLRDFSSGTCPDDGITHLRGDGFGMQYALMIATFQKARISGRKFCTTVFKQIEPFYDQPEMPKILWNFIGGDHWGPRAIEGKTKYLGDEGFNPDTYEALAPWYSSPEVTYNDTQLQAMVRSFYHSTPKKALDWFKDGTKKHIVLHV